MQGNNSAARDEKSKLDSTSSRGQKGFREHNRKLELNVSRKRGLLNKNKTINIRVN